MMESRLKPLLTLSDLVELLNVTRMTIWQWTKDGHLPQPYKLGSKQYWRAEEIEAVLEAGRGARRKAR
jgi:predicted DNA-binding transcriptional regulator AlpA